MRVFAMQVVAAHLWLSVHRTCVRVITRSEI